jgi:hypothetical protein
MKWQKVTLFKSQTVNIGVPTIFNLPNFGYIGSIMLEWNGTIVSGYGAAGGAWRLIDKISSVVVQHGSTPIKSLTGLQLQGVAAFDQNLIPPGTYRNYGAANVFEYSLINFGRYLRDPGMGLDLSTWNNVQLIINNTAVAATDIASMTVSIYAWVLVGAPAHPFRGFMDTQTWRTWTTVQAQQVNNILPADDIIRRIFLQATPHITQPHADTGMHNLMSKIHLDTMTGQVVLYDEDSEALIRDNLFENYGYWMQGGAFYGNALAAPLTTLGYRLGIAAGASAPEGVAVATVDVTVQTQQSEIVQEFISAQADRPASYIEFGLAPFGLMVFHFDDDPDPATWLDPNAEASVDLNITTRDAASAAAGTAAIILDRYHPY